MEHREESRWEGWPSSQQAEVSSARQGGDKTSGLRGVGELKLSHRVPLRL